MTTLLAFALLGIPQQGGAGGFGGGGIGGGRLGDSALGGQEQKFTHILTPGDKTDWKLSVKAGEVAVLHVSSGVFDPAVEVVDSAGKVIASNDDMAPGNQEAHLMVVFPKDGDYNAHVLNYRSSSGGQYDLSIQRFLTQPAEMGKVTVVDQPNSQTAHMRMSLKKGQMGICRLTNSSEYIRVLGPNGIWVRQVNGLPSYKRSVFQATEDGDYIATFRTSPGTAFSAQLAREVQGGPVSEPTVMHLPAAGLDVWKFHAAAGAFLTADARSQDYVGVGVLDPEDGTSPIDILDSNSSTAVMKRWNRKWIFVKKETDIRLVVQADENAPVDYQLTFGDAFKPWNMSAPVHDALPLRADHYWAIDAKAGDLLKLAVFSDAFDGTLSVLNAGGEIITSADDTAATDPNPSLELAVPATGRYYVCVGSSGGGGTGNYSLTSTRLPVQALAFGKALPIPEKGSSVFEFEAAKGQLLAISLKGEEQVANVYGPDGAELRLQWPNIDGEMIGMLKAPAAGRYRLWVRSGVKQVRVDSLPR